MAPTTRSGDGAWTQAARSRGITCSARSRTVSASGPPAIRTCYVGVTAAAAVALRVLPVVATAALVWPLTTPTKER